MKANIYSWYPIMFQALLACLIWIPHQADAAGFRQFVDLHCAECHDGDAAEGGFDLSRYSDEASVMNDRSIWRMVYEKLESRQMPPPKRESQPTDAERTAFLEWIDDVAARPDPLLGARDPGKPVLRRLTRLEYNNAIRDLFGLEIDVFMFPERLPIADKAYFQPATGRLQEPIKITMREYGAKYPVLCPQLGLPGDHRAEHGYRNRGDAMDFSPLLLEKYLVSAREIVYSPDLPVHSTVAAELFGIDPPTRQALAANRNRKQPASKEDATFSAASDFAPKLATWLREDAKEFRELQRFRESLQKGIANNVGVVFDAGDTATQASIIPGKGGLIRVAFADGAKKLTINPNADLWVVGFSTADATSGGKLFCNHQKGQKQFELTFKLEDSDDDEGIEQLAVCVLGRKKQSGAVTITARLTDDTEVIATVDIAEGPSGTRFVQLAAIPGESIKSLVVDGTKFSGDYVLLDDLALITNGRPRPARIVENSSSQPPVTESRESTKSIQAQPSLDDETKAVRTGLHASPRDRLKAFISKAFRRRVSDADVEPFTLLLDSSRKDGKSDQDAMREALASVLASPQFLFVETNGVVGNEHVSRLEDSELATRLALFLWTSTPDDALLELAQKGLLYDSTVLEQQTLRMLRDPKSRELGESFAMQWLRLDQLYTAKPDSDLFKAFYSGPQGKSTLHGAMLTEALLLFETVQIEDRSILDFVAADYSWLNPGLAKLYGIPLESDTPGALTVVDTTRELKTKKEEPAWRRIPLPDTQRGGFITMAAPLVVTSLPFRTSPVKRGAWLLETIFNRPPTEPKVAFAIENDTKEAAQQMSIRQKFESHRSKEACYSCHVRLDPPGFALERFDPIGRWRDMDGKQAVDAKEDWQGKAFDGPAAFKAILAENPHEFTRGFIEHMLSYALGRELQTYDMPTVTQIQNSARADGWKFNRIIVEIVKSYPFNYVRQSVTSF